MIFADLFQKFAKRTAGSVTIHARISEQLCCTTGNVHVIDGVQIPSYDKGSGFLVIEPQVVEAAKPPKLIVTVEYFVQLGASNGRIPIAIVASG